MPDQKTRILTERDMLAKIKRIAYQIAEDNYCEEDIYLAGIKENGMRIAKALAKELRKIVDGKVHLGSIEINKADPVSEPAKISFKDEELRDKVIILVDDVANSGRTLMYALHPLLHILPKKIQIAVLVDRKHKRFAVAADYVGMSLSTTLQEHVQVELDGEEAATYLS